MPDELLTADSAADPVDSNLTGHSVRSGFVQVGAQGAKFVLGVGSAMVLARLLTPRDFGLMAMVSSLTAFISSFNHFGLPMATVHRKDVRYAQVSALFWTNLKLHVLIVAFMCAMAPVLAWFYDAPQLTAMTFAVAGGVFCLSLAVQHEGLLKRHMRFGTLALVEVSALCVGVGAGVGTALLGAGYWALVCQFVATNAAKALALWLACDWRPDGPTAHAEDALDGLQAMRSYGFHYTGSSVLGHVSRNLDRVLIGYVSGAAALGLYDNAFRWSRFPLRQLYSPLLSVAVAGLSRVQQAPATYRTYFRRGLLPVLAVCMPTLAFASVEARAVILVLLGEQWLGAVPLFRLLCLAAFLRSVSKVTDWLYLSKGETKRQLRWQLFAAPVMVAGVVAGIQWGALGVAVGYTTAAALLTAPSIAFCLKTSHLSPRDFLRIVWRPLLASAAAALAPLALPLTSLEVNSSLVELLVTAPTFSLIYLLVWLLLPGGWQATTDVLRLFTALRSGVQQPPSPSSAAS